MKINITETVLRDANQSLLATRMPFDDFSPILKTMDAAGYYSIECWGGATFDSCLRYLNEDPWERLRKIRTACPNTKLQMLLRGQNLLGYKPYPDDIVRKFVRKSVENGIDIIRIFDALNDLRNIETATAEAIAAGAHVQGTICYTTRPGGAADDYIALAKQIERMGCHSICIKDMAGIISPADAFSLVAEIKSAVQIPIAIHTHCTTGLAEMTYLKAIEAGATIIDCATSCLSGGTSQPSTQSMSYALSKMGYSSELDEIALKAVNDFFVPVRARAQETGMLDPRVLETSADALTYQIPGGMLSNLIAQLKSQNALDRLQEVLEETPRVRADLGYPPLVTPSSQMVGVQAATNVLTGARYKNISKEVKAYIRGKYGKAPCEINEELRKMVLGDENPIECRFADTLPDGFAAAKQEIGALARCDEDVLSYIAFPQIAEKFLKERMDMRKRTVSYTITRAE